MEPILAPESIDLIALAPVLVLSVFAMMVLVVDLFGGRNKTLLVFISLVGLLMTAISAFAKHPIPAYSFNDSYIVDHLSLFFICIFTISSALTILLSVEYNKREGINPGEYFALILFCTVGMILLASATDMIMIFLGIEIVSICLYVLTGIQRGNVRSNEAALKYFLLGAFATGFLLYGMTLIYGSTGSTNLFKIAEVTQNLGAQSNPLLLMGLVLLIIGFGFKVASVPFHMWSPDVYQGAPTPVTAFMSVGPKAAAFAAFFRVFAEAFPAMSPSWELLLTIIAVLSMFFGNLGAIMQTNIKRMLAFSSISHAGFLIMAVITKTSLAGSSLLFYMLAYSFTTFGIFGIVILLGRKGEENLEMKNYSGLAYKHPILALSMTILLFSLAGLPPFAGFIAKFYLFSAAIQEGLVTLVIIAVLNSAVSFYYYLKVIIFMYMKEQETEFRIALTPLTLFVIVIGVLGTLGLGIFPNSIIALASY
ncbi:MAG: NADH-quinone oxidoreductase subunit N [Nitrospinaceae bacterium]|nr:NADH-quinone oxidoreductase subunit N [Nitrospina sp.]MBT5867453.1 NADH-quinone oxidoreductase subunit N [Nitrospinaceae bacterium]MBT6345323.1 NADH-quinone oxidoreductase subunit N [Nitrospina sp.]